MEMYTEKRSFERGPCLIPLNFTVLSTHGRKTKDIQPNVLSDVLLAEYILKKEQNQRFKIDPRWNASESFDDYVTDIRLSGMYGTEGLEILSFIKKINADTAVIIMTAYGTDEIKVEAYKGGALHYYEKSKDINDLISRYKL